MSYRLRVAADALADLQEIADFIGRDNPTRARSFVAEPRARAREVTAHPMAYRVRNEMGTGVRVTGYRGYLLFYRVSDAEVRLLRVMHGARELSGLTFD